MMTAYFIVSRCRLANASGQFITKRGTHQVIAESIDAAKAKLAKHLKTGINPAQTTANIDMRVISMEPVATI